MRDDLERVLGDLLARGAREGAVDLDTLASAFDGLSVSNDEIDQVLTRFEDAGGVLRSPEGGGVSERLKKVLTSARSLSAALGRVPTASEIATSTGLGVVEVRQALALGRVMGR